MYLNDLITPTLRLGVTGLSRAGKTVFITGLVQTLLNQNAQPPLRSLLTTPGLRVFLEPQPDDDVPRFQYEDHLAALTGDAASWPESTRRISQLRITFEWPARDFARSAIGVPERLHVDIVDYPGEWLIDLGLLGQTYQQWSRDAIQYARTTRPAEISQPFLDFAVGLNASSALDEQVAIDGAKLFTQYLREARVKDPARAVVGPGRFLLPGELEGSPLLTFFPLPDLDPAKPSRQGTLLGLLERRFESYKTRVVEPFFKRHFSRLDRQIVLIDLLTALNGGAQGLSDLEHGLEGVLKAFRPGVNSWLSLLLPRRIDRIVFAATKADHIHFTSHDRLAAILRKAVARAEARSHTAGATTDCIALAALRATEDVDKRAHDTVYHCVRGRPADGERIEGRRFDGRRDAVVFPGDLPEDPLAAFDEEIAKVGQYAFTRFAPPQLGRDPDGAIAVWPHVGLEHILSFLIGDQLP